MTALLDLAKKFSPKTRPRKATPVRSAQNTLPTDAPKVRAVFMGTPELAAVILTGLIEKKYTIVGVVTKPDKPAGRDQEAVASAVKQKAIEYDLPIEQPVRLNQAAVEKIKSWKPDIIIVAPYGKILPPGLPSLPGFGCINVHTSL